VKVFSFWGETPSLKALSEISPVSQIMVPRGWTIRKQGVIIFTVAISLDFKP